MQWQVKSQYRDKPLNGPIVLWMHFVESTPLSASKKKRAEMLAGEIVPSKADCTNYQKFFEDCLKNIVFLDDRYVAKNISEKAYGEKGVTKIRVYTLKEYRAKHGQETDQTGESKQSNGRVESGRAAQQIKKRPAGKRKKTGA